MKKLNIAFEDKNILVINKPSGVLTIATDKEKEKHFIMKSIIIYTKRIKKYLL